MSKYKLIDPQAVVREPELLSRRELEEILSLTDPGDVREVCELAGEATRLLHGSRVTYVRNRNINYTSVCEYQCRFCGYWRSPGDPEAQTLTVPEILRRAAAVRQYGVSELCITGGLNPELHLDYYLDLLQSLHAAFPDLHIHAFSPEEAAWLARRQKMTVRNLLRCLKQSGLGSMPGTAAEILCDDVRRQICPQKVSSQEWEYIIRTAHELGIPTTATMLVGHVESPAHRAAHFAIIRHIQRQTGGFTEFVPLPFVPYHTGLRDRVPEMLSQTQAKLVHAAARLFFGPLLPNIQVSWVKLGPQLAAEILGCGANDLGGTLFEENITRSAGGRYGQALSEAELRQIIHAAGRLPVCRDTLYQRLDESAGFDAAPRPAAGRSAPESRVD